MNDDPSDTIRDFLIDFEDADVLKALVKAGVIDTNGTLSDWWLNLLDPTKLDKPAKQLIDEAIDRLEKLRDVV